MKRSTIVTWAGLRWFTRAFLLVSVFPVLLGSFAPRSILTPLAFATPADQSAATTAPPQGPLAMSAPASPLQARARSATTQPAQAGQLALPAQPYPADQAMFVPIQSELRWSGAHSDGRLVTYTVQLARDGGAFATVGTTTSSDCQPSGGSGGLSPGWRETMIAGLPTLLKIPANYSPDRPTHLLFFLHGDEGAYGSLGSEEAEKYNWIYASPRAFLSTDRLDFYSWWRSDYTHLERMERFFAELYRDYNLCQNALYGVTASGGSIFWTGTFFPHFGDRYPAQALIFCSGTTRGMPNLAYVEDDKLQARASDPEVVARSTFQFAYGDLDFTLPSIEQAITDYSRLGFTVIDNRLPGAVHCHPNPDEVMATFFQEVSARAPRFQLSLPEALEPATAYSWRVIADDGTTQQTSPTWSFRTGYHTYLPLALTPNTTTINGWQPLDQIPEMRFNDIFCASASTCFAVGTGGGALLRSDDGGATWSFQATNTSYPLVRGTCLDANHCYVIGAFGTFLATNNGGASWNTQGRMEIAALGGEMYTSFTDIACLDPQTCFISAQSSGESLIYATADGGATWRMAQTSPGNLSAIECTTAQTCMAVGGTQVLITNDGGQTWRTQTVSEAMDLQTIDCVDLFDCTAGGFAGVARSFDGGNSWTYTQLRDDAGNFMVPWDLTCRDQFTCIAVGTFYQGDQRPNVIATTYDGWQTYRFDIFPANDTFDQFKGVACPSGGEVCYVASLGGYTLRQGDSAKHNQPPVVALDRFSIPRNSPPVLFDPLANDRDPDGDQLTLLGIEPSRYAAGFGTVSIVNNQVQFVPGSGLDQRTGLEFFAYIASDGRGGLVRGTMLVTVQRR